MATVCFGSVKGLVARVTRLTAVGLPVTGATGGAITKGFVKVDSKRVNEDGQEFIVKNANGDLCINERDEDRLKRLEVQIDFCKVDPALFELATAARLLVDASTPTPRNVGFAIGETDPENANFALEVWAKNPAPGAGEPPYVYWLWPWIRSGRFSDATIENGAATFPVFGFTKGNPNWGVGPYGDDVLVDPIQADEHLAILATDVIPPTAVCGYSLVPA